MSESLVVHDWPNLWKDFQASGLMQKTWASNNGLNDTHVSREFAKIRREKADRQIERARIILASKAPLAARNLNSKINSDDENVSLKASISILGAVGISPQTAAIQINNKTEVNILSVPIFAAQAEPMMQALLGDKLADTASDD